MAIQKAKKIGQKLGTNIKAAGKAYVKSHADIYKASAKGLAKLATMRDVSGKPIGKRGPKEAATAAGKTIWRNDLVLRGARGAAKLGLKKAGRAIGASKGSASRSRLRMGGR